MHQRMVLILFIFLVPGIALAKLQQAPSTAKTPSDFKFSGYVDGSYNYLQNSNKFASGTYDRVFDINPNGLTLQQVGITLAYQPQQGFGGLMTPVAGSDPNIFAPYGWNIHSFAMPQAYMQYASGSLTFMGGSFIELAGAENIFSHNDTNFSRSILWGYAEPFTVTGFRVSYIPNNQLTLVGGINNGWDNIRDTSRQKTIELGASYTLTPSFL